MKVTAPARTVTDAQAVRSALGKLASRGPAWLIRDYLLRHGHRGACMSSASCPVAFYIRAATGVEVLVTPDGYWLGDDRLSSPPRRLPGEVGTFVAAFDNHDYPELENR